jgi:c-di-GMP-binding flagellar brake protein YcgR
VRDLSKGGLGIEIDGEYPDSYEKLAGAKGKVDVDLDLGEGETISVKARVAWASTYEKEGRKFFRVGLEFAKVRDEDRERLSAFIRMKMDEKLIQDEEKRDEGRK